MAIRISLFPLADHFRVVSGSLRSKTYRSSASVSEVLLAKLVSGRELMCGPLLNFDGSKPYSPVRHELPCQVGHSSLLLRYGTPNSHIKTKPSAPNAISRSPSWSMSVKVGE